MEQPGEPANNKPLTFCQRFIIFEKRILTSTLVGERSNLDLQYHAQELLSFPVSYKNNLTFSEKV